MTMRTDLLPEHLPVYEQFFRTNTPHRRVQEHPEAFIRLVRRQRTAMGLSLRAAARLCGLNEMYICSVERGLYVPSEHYLYAIMDGLAITSADIVAEIAAILDEEVADDQLAA